MTYGEFISEWRGVSTFCCVHTSGSTGSPKSIELPKSLMERSAWRTLHHFRLSASSRLHSCISPDFIGGKMQAVRAEVSGTRLTWESPSNRPAIISSSPGVIESLDSCNGEASKLSEWPDLISVVPSQMLHILDAFEQIPDSVAWLIGGQAIPPQLRRRIAERGLNAWESYGMTETASHIALRRVREEDDEGFFTPLEGIGISLDSRGCLVIDQGEDMPVVTNDVATLQADGRFRILGRADNVIISGGKKIHPEEVERQMQPLLAPLGITDLMLTSAPDHKWGERLVLLAEMPQTASIPTGDTQSPLSAFKALPPVDRPDFIRTLLHDHLPAHQVPKEIHLLPTLPRTPNGKLRRHKTEHR